MNTWWKLLCSKGNNSESRHTRVTVHVFCMSSHGDLHICVKFRENITNGFRVMERTRVHCRNGYVQCSNGNNSKSSKPELRFMCSIHRFMVLYICVKFRENISNGSYGVDKKS